MDLDVQAYLTSLSDTDLVDNHRQAFSDLAEAARTQRNSEWHQACFAATIVYAEEMVKRGLHAPDKRSAVISDVVYALH
jgi:hypothetical protein